MDAKLNVEQSMMNSIEWSLSFYTSNDTRMVLVQGYWNWMGDNSTSISSTTVSVSQNTDYSRCMKKSKIANTGDIACGFR